jgi:hypothetical protein
MADQVTTEQYLPKGSKSRKSITTITKTPIEFVDAIGGDPLKGGEWTPDSSFGLQLSKAFPIVDSFLRRNLSGLYSHIQLNPNAPTNLGDIPSAIHHEEAHALVDSDIPKIDFSQIQSFPDIARAIAGRGSSSHEAPAYDVERGTTIVPQATKDVFSQEFLNQLQKVDPAKAATFQQLINNYSGSGIQ